MLKTALVLVTSSAYLFAAFLIARQVLGDFPSKQSNRAIALATLAASAHLIVHVWLSDGGIPQLHFFTALSVVALGMAILSLVASALEKLSALGVLVFPLAAACLLLFAFVQNPGATAVHLSWQIQLHAGFSLLAYATLALATLIATTLWTQERALRSKHINAVIRALPPITQTEALLFRSLVASFALLSIGLLTGVVFVADLFAQHLVHKTVLSLLSWLCLLILLVGHWRNGWRGARAARWTLSAMVLLALAFFGSKLVLEIILQRV